MNAPSSQSTQFEACYTAKSTFVAQAARELMAFALVRGLGPTCRARVGTAVAELFDNAWRHGYLRTGGPVDVRASLFEKSFHVEVRDHGRGFDERTVDPDRKSGFAHVRALAETVRIETRPSFGTCVTLSFAPWPATFDERDSIDLGEFDFLTPEVSRRVLAVANRAESARSFQLSPALAVVVGRLLSGPDRRASIEKALWS